MKHTHKLMVKFEGAKVYERYGVFFSEDDAWDAGLATFSEHNNIEDFTVEEI